MKLETSVGGQGSEGRKEKRLDDNGRALQRVYVLLVKADYGTSRRAPVCGAKNNINVIEYSIFCFKSCAQSTNSWMCVCLSVLLFLRFLPTG